MRRFVFVLTFSILFLLGTTLVIANESSDSNDSNDSSDFSGEYIDCQNLNLAPYESVPAVCECENPHGCEASVQTNVDYSSVDWSNNSVVDNETDAGDSEVASSDVSDHNSY